MTRGEALRVLGLDGDPSRHEIASAYRELAQMLHPDKYGSDQRLRRRAEQQMRIINEARDALLKTAPSSRAKGPDDAARRHRSARAGAARDPRDIADEADLRARAAEAARILVSQEARTLRERRTSMAGLTAVSALVLLVTFRMPGMLGNIVQSVALMLTVWGIYDMVATTHQAGALRGRMRELADERDRARDIADEARALQ